MYVAYHPQTGLTLARIELDKPETTSNVGWNRMVMRPVEFSTAGQAMQIAAKFLKPGMSKHILAQNNTVRKSV